MTMGQIPRSMERILVNNNNNIPTENELAPISVLVGGDRGQNLQAVIYW